MLSLKDLFSFVCACMPIYVHVDGCSWKPEENVSPRAIITGSFEPLDKGF